MYVDISKKLKNKQTKTEEVERNYKMSKRLSLIVRVNVVLNRTVVVDGD